MTAKCRCLPLDHVGPACSCPPGACTLGLDAFDSYVRGECELCDYDRGRGLWYSPCPHEGSRL